MKKRLITLNITALHRPRVIVPAPHTHSQRPVGEKQVPLPSSSCALCQYKLQARDLTPPGRGRPAQRASALEVRRPKGRTDQITSSSIHLLEASISASYSSRFPAAMLRPHLPSPMRVYPARHSYHHAEQMLPLSHASASTCAGQIVTLRNKRKLRVIAPARRAGSTSPRLACLIKAAT